MPDPRFPPLVSLACHDLRTPLATVYGFARTLSRAGTLDERSARFVEMIEAAAEQMTELLDELGMVARVEGDRYEPLLTEADTLELALSEDERIEVTGAGETVETDVPAMKRSLERLAVAAARHGAVDHVTWTVQGRVLVLAPLRPEAAPVVMGEQVRDMGALVAGRVIVALGGSVASNGDSLVVRL